MVRILMVTLLSLAAACVFDVPPAQAISRNNPYRSFNISGYNYGSTQWQKRNGRGSNKSYSTGRSGGWLFRGR